MDYTNIIETLGADRVKRSEPLAAHTYFKLGGPADLFYEAKTADELAGAVKCARGNKVPVWILGGGSNVLVTDKGVRGLVVANRTGAIQLVSFAGGGAKGKLAVQGAVIRAESGVPINKLVRYTVDEGLAGLEDFLGLPGTVGGAIFNNSHHLEELIGDHVVEVEVVDSRGDRKTYLPRDLMFAYDYSILHKTHETVLSVSFRLTRGDKQVLWEKANLAVRHRATTQPLGAPSSGCMFRNVSLADAMRLGTPNTTRSSGYLIDKTGLKGARVGGAYVSGRHANFIVNDGTATSADVLNLIALVRRKVKANFGVKLELEVVVVGER